MTIGSLLSDRKREKKKEHLFILFSLYITPDGLGGCAETHTEPFSLQQQKVFFFSFLLLNPTDCAYAIIVRVC